MLHNQPFDLAVLAASGAGLVVLAASRLSQRVRVPLPALVLVASAVAARAVPQVHAPSEAVVSDSVSIALVAVLFDGGIHIGWSRFRNAAVPILVVGVAGTFGTVALASVLVHWMLNLGWYASLLLATAVSPTDPAVVFSVLGRRQIAGPSGTILEGESGANDPVGIALMTALIGAGALTSEGVAHAVATFAEQMAIGAAIGYVGGKALLLLMRRVPLPGEGLYPLRTFAAAYLLFAAASIAHGSGFLAVFTAGIVVGDERAPFKREIERFHDAMSSLGEIVAFVVLGLTVDLNILERTSTWLPGLALGVALAVAIRPVVIWACLVRTRLSRRERTFVQFAGLKGAVPILLGSYLLTTKISSAPRLYEMVVVVVVLSVVAQGATMGAVTHRLQLPVQLVEPEPWSYGVRLRDEPQNVHHLVVTAGSPAEGIAVAKLQGLPGDAWLSLVVREGHLVPVRGSTVLQAGDRLTVLAAATDAKHLKAMFETSG